MERLNVGETEVLIGPSLPEPLLPERPGRSRVAILTQPAPTNIALAIARDIEAEGLATEVVGLPDREAAKTLEVASSVYDVLAKFGLTRSDTVVAIGGGSVSDLGGFVAGTWMRGVESVIFPTTLLGAVDASIGGKTGVNVAGKNLVGVFWHPSRVAIDTSQLATLPSFLIRDGMSEAFKAGLIGDPELVATMARDALTTNLDFVVRRAIAVKSAIVGADAHETGIRAHLNFGHTIGHAVEYASTLSHGEAVALGMVAAARISANRLGFKDEELITETLKRLTLPTTVEGLNQERVVDLLRRDKKRDASGLRMVLLTEIGDPTVQHVSHQDVSEGLAAVGF